MADEINEDEILDVQGEICPYPEVKTIKKIKKMKSGQVLKILMDYPLSSERIPRRLEKDGHDVLKVDKVGESKWEVYVKVK